jgi:hypothetical protein
VHILFTSASHCAFGSRGPGSLSNAMLCASVGVPAEIGEAFELCSFGLAVKPPAMSAAAGSGPCYEKAQMPPKDREGRGTFPVARSAPVQVFGRRSDDLSTR